MEQHAMYGRKYLERQKRRRRRRLKAYACYFARMGLFVFLVMFAAMKLTEGLQHYMDKNVMETAGQITAVEYTEQTTQHMVDSETGGLDADYMSSDSLVEQGYPESLVELFDKNPEARQFVLDYRKHADDGVSYDISGEVTEGVIPHFLQWDERWGYSMYGDDFMAVTGCGPTCLSMVYCGLTGDDRMSPPAVAEKAFNEGYYVDGAGSSWDMMTTLANEMGLYVNSVIFDEYHITNELQSGNPIICIMGPGTFTTTGHFIVLYGIDGNGNILIKDPNSILKTNTSWTLDELMPQINNLWSYSYYG